MAAQNNTKKIKKSAASGNSFINFFIDLKAEVKRITWASKENVKKATATVLIFCLIYVVIVGLLDVGFKNLFSVIFK
ncbi:preprotein translocase subunit SecE [Clostridium sp. P21]|uniref:Protein translocase subunit SecE n=1 Tax=Clostridium muellerianum TaxID=2716538 RepID=A0A7Y0EHH0_9CLOT|nr:preprotein translocase subunit SecE [Clostridium muellerianum]NMM63486.1 preprotein translocase subunit SecE [Clostridium muellerianum]